MRRLLRRPSATKATEAAPRRASAPVGARSWVLLILDSCRYDSFQRAHTPELSALGPIAKRYSFATWTAPSHYNMLMGLLPHDAKPGEHSTDEYARIFAGYANRLGVPLDLGKLAPALWLPEFLNQRGWHTGAYVSMPVLNPATSVSRGFQRYELWPQHNDLRGMIEQLRFYNERPSFWLLNAGETHYPFERPDRSYAPLPRLSGLNGTLRKLRKDQDTPAFFTETELKNLHQRQVEAVEYVDSLIPLLRALTPPDTWLTVTSDHGELFGEDGYFGHGPVHHPKILEVPFVEGPLHP